MKKLNCIENCIVTHVGHFKGQQLQSFLRSQRLLAYGDIFISIQGHTFRIEHGFNVH